MKQIAVTLGIFGWCLIQPSQATDEHDYFLFHVGDEWTREVEMRSADGQSAQKLLNHKKVVSKIENDGRVYLRLRTWSDGDVKVFQHGELVRRDESGIYLIEDGDSSATEHLLISFPLQVGAHWMVKSGNKTYITRLVGIEAVSIDGKTYDKCCHFRTESLDGHSIEDFWEAPNVGTVKSEIVLPNKDRINITLREFHSAR